VSQTTLRLKQKKKKKRRRRKLQSIKQKLVTKKMVRIISKHMHCL